ncbi:hypothetical protein SGQ44_06480 [Flavobacterium sp. Fl-77]|uniref:Uncharacterized protein n=1 Tax=Flavobacterium flavipigmentatum TaxID=2893884 RepID=A0AAJ2SBM1_9FLAO|nr:MULTISPECIES: hypothetical protein [unclassified Flavobacterium]MDX6181570.1 hypothetical protein [Flavobacterium sp. Fl-33]MDX6185396.1 hypothetical protein [Flavobacterium sp. Fl-77]UFH37499.1 hypothetical protein LNP22_12210 [Flavobacterium sp. F-70]
MEESKLDQIQSPKNLESIYTDGKAYAEAVSYATNADQRLETKDYLKDAQIQKLLSEVERYREDTTLRKSLAMVFTSIIALWLFAVIMILVGNYCNSYNLSDNVLIALLVTSTANVIGMMLIILKNLFPSGDLNATKV